MYGSVASSKPAGGTATEQRGMDIHDSPTDGPKNNDVASSRSQAHFGLVVLSCSLFALVFGVVLASTLNQKEIPRAAMATATATTLALPNPTTTLSSRGQGVKAVRDDLQMYLAAASDPYHPTENTDGYLVMLVAENKQMWNEMAHKLESVQASRQLPEWTFLYGDMGGQRDFKQSIAHMMQKWIDPPVNPDKLRFQAGAGSVLDQLSYTLADTNDGVLVMAPNYGAFGGDFGIYGNLKLHVAPTKAENGYAPTVAELDDCFDRSLAAGNPPKILIICQPNNPTGIIYSYDAMLLMITWALQRGLHVVSDEIYALSVFPGHSTVSAAQIMADLNAGQENYLGDRVHIVAGLSKDWGMSGFRVGSLFTHNAMLLQAMDLLGYYQSVSQYTQQMLTGVFDDHAWVDWYVAENQKRLFENYKALREALSLVHVPVLQSHGGLFAWADFSSLLKDGQTEKELWLELFDKPKVALTSGESCNGDKPGLFRIVYAWPEGGTAAMRELGERLVQWKSERE
jgi:aspartate/methionine/tyrosine aminotransferase